jgi:hypothetical protein
MSKLLGVSRSSCKVSGWERLGQEKGQRAAEEGVGDLSGLVDWGKAGSWVLRALAPFHDASDALLEAEPKLPDGQTCPSPPSRQVLDQVSLRLLPSPRDSL